MDTARRLERPRHGLLSHLDDAQFERLSRLLKLTDAVTGSAIVVQGDAADSMFFVVEGTAQLERYGLKIGLIGQGDAFGELGLLTGRRRAATVRATTPMQLLLLDARTWDRILLEEPLIASRLLMGVVDGLGQQLLSMTDNASLAIDERASRAGERVRVGFVENGDVVRTEVVQRGTAIASLLPGEWLGVPVVGALVDNHPTGLDARIKTDVRLEPLTVASPEGRQIVRHSADLLVLSAAARVLPGVKILVGGSLGIGRVLLVDGDAEAIVGTLTQEIERMIATRLPFHHETWSLEQARAWLAANGHGDAVGSLRSVPSPSIEMAGVGDLFLPTSSPVLPNAERLAGIRLLPHPDGLLLDYGPLLSARFSGPNIEAWGRHESVAPRFGGEMVRTHEAWLEAMEITDVGSYNNYCVGQHLRDLIRVSEGFHEKRLGRIADAIAERQGRVRIICIAGPSSSGKTTFIKRLTVQLEVNGIHPVNLSLDDYYVDRERTPRDEKGEYDFEAFEAIDLPLLQRHLREILSGRPTRTSRYDFVKGKSDPTGGPELTLKGEDVLLIEGIHGLNPLLIDGAATPDQVYRAFVHPAASLRFDAAEVLATSDVRLLRRIVRDRHSRGYSAADTISRWPSVRRGEAVHIYPTLQHADVVFDTSLAYEMSILKVFAERYLLEVPQWHASFPTALRLRRLLDRFVSIYPDHVPPTSFLREFIGGSGFEY